MNALYHLDPETQWFLEQDYWFSDAKRRRFTRYMAGWMFFILLFTVLIINAVHQCNWIVVITFIPIVWIMSLFYAINNEGREGEKQVMRRIHGILKDSGYERLGRRPPYA